MRRLREAAARHGCTIILLGHVAKAMDADAPSMRGSSAWVANSRFAYALWRPAQDEAKRGAIKLKLNAERLVWGNLVKANHAGAPVGQKKLLMRDKATGRLTEFAEKGTNLSDKELIAILVEACAECAAAGLPFAYSGVAGLWNGRADLPEEFAGVSKRRLEKIGTAAVDQDLLVKAHTAETQSAPKFLDVPDGPLAQGVEVPMFQGSRKEALARYRADKGQ